MAPGANVRYYGAKSCEDPDIADTLDTVVDENQVTIVSNSYGEPESAEALERRRRPTSRRSSRARWRASTFFFSSGDNGDEQATTGTLQADYPASDPYITSVGGTSTGIAADGSLAFQTGWGTQKYALSADGVRGRRRASCTARAAATRACSTGRTTRQGIRPASPAGRAVTRRGDGRRPDHRHARRRDAAVPGRSRRYGEYRIGGTSLASPLMAGVQALTQQRAGGRMGFINPALYKAGKNQPGQFLDVARAGAGRGQRARRLRQQPRPVGRDPLQRPHVQPGLEPRVTPGWDDVTGFGAPSPKYINAFGG